MSNTTIFRRQKLILRVFFWVFKPFALFTRRLDWVVGPEDIALMATHIAASLPRSYTAIHARNRFYPTIRYDAVIQTASTALGGRWAIWRRLYGGPLLLAWLVNRSRGFIYVGGGAFLEGHHDEREFEFSFIRRHHRRLVCYFTGNDIRSPKLMAELAERTGYPNLGTALAALDPIFMTPEYDSARRLRAKVADRHAEIIFNARLDQLSYLERPTEPFLYFYPDDDFLTTTDKFRSLEKIVILHAPSKPVLKGTDHVRAAIEILSQERDDFEYRELVDVSNQDVLGALDDAHIALNEFYAYMPGIFGIEALARRCVLVTSADGREERDLPEGANDAWVIARVHDLLDKVRWLLDHPDDLERQSEVGWRWARENASAHANGRRLREILDRAPQD